MNQGDYQMKNCKLGRNDCNKCPHGQLYSPYHCPTTFIPDCPYRTYYIYAEDPEPFKNTTENPFEGLDNKRS